MVTRSNVKPMVMEKLEVMENEMKWKMRINGKQEVAEGKK
jgi:hypothetical protein